MLFRSRLSVVYLRSKLCRASSTIARASMTSGCLDLGEILVLSFFDTHSLVASTFATTNRSYTVLGPSSVSSSWKRFLTSTVYLAWWSGLPEKVFQSWWIFGLGLGTLRLSRTLMETTLWSEPMESNELYSCVLDRSPPLAPYQYVVQLT